MEFSIQPVQFMYFSLYIVLFYTMWPVKITKWRAIIFMLLLILVAFNPVRFKQSGMARIERTKAEPNGLPARIYVEQETFENKQSAEMQQLKTQSEGLKNEIHN